MQGQAGLTACTMALFILAATATKTGIVTPEFRLGAHIGFRHCVVMIVVAIRAVHMGLRWWSLAAGHDVSSRGFESLVADISRVLPNILWVIKLLANATSSDCRYQVSYNAG